MEIIQNGVRVLFLPEIALVIRRMMKGITQGDGTPGRERPGFFFLWRNMVAISYGLC